MIDILTASRYFMIYQWAKNKNIDLSYSLYPNQITSKLWLIDELKKINLPDSLNIEIVGSWFGWPLVGFLYENFKINKMTLYDIDNNANQIAYRYSKVFRKNVNIITQNYWKNADRKSDADVVINCSSEHMFETFSDYNMHKSDCLFVIQSNNLYEEPTHINCCNSEDELVEIHDFRKILYKGSQEFNDLNTVKYKRYMVIGYI